MERSKDFYKVGLTEDEVHKRIVTHQVNYVDEPKTKTIKQIIQQHTFTFFNFINVVLGSLAILSGIIGGDILYGLKNCLFVGVIFWNTIISIVEEILAKKTIDKLRVVSESKIKVIRESKEIELSKEELVKDDVCLYQIGNQVVTDSIILNGKVEVNESFITGEEKPILKREGDTILSGSFIVSGQCYVSVSNIGKDNYVSKISNEAKYIKPINSLIYNSFDKLLKVLSACLVIIGIILLINQLIITGGDVSTSLMSTVSALIGMIPEGLVLLTSSAMAVSVIRLRKYNVLVQELYAIENLARVDVLCLDKTGTITEGLMEVKDIVLLNGNKIDNVKNILSKYIYCMNNDNSKTFIAVKNYINNPITTEILDTLDFSSDRKYSGVSITEGNYYLGSPENLFQRKLREAESYENDYRLLVLCEGKSKFGDISKVKPMALILIQDKIKANAEETLRYFKEQGIDIKIISGDNDKTVAEIARRAGLTDIRSVDFSKIDDKEIKDALGKYNILGRVKPEQKKKIIKALQSEGHFVGMTGDGVNDCLALKQSDCSIAMASGSEAAKNVSQFVLLDSKIDNLPLILKEGRRSINNIERSSALLFSKTIFTIILILFCIGLQTEYFFIPIHLTLITTFTIGIPSFLLALESNHDLVKGNFLKKIFLKSFPSALTVVFNVIIIKLFERQFGLDTELCSTLTVFLTATTGFIFLDSICRPYNKFHICLMAGLLISFLYCSIFQYEFFNISYITGDTILVFIVLFICSLFIFEKLQQISKWLLKKEL